MSELFRLVVVHGITDGCLSLEGSSQVRSFFSTTFPTAEIVEFQFPNTSPSQPFASIDLHHQARSIGKKLVEKTTLDDNGIKYSSQSNDTPLIFIGHDIGGCIIKRMLLLASEETIFKPILRRVKGVIFVGTPHKGPNLTVWEHHIICLLASSRRPLPFPSQYLQILPQQLSDNAELFAEISWDFEILNLIQARRELSGIFGTDARYETTLHETFTRLDSPKAINIDLKCSHAELWQFKPENPESETVCAKLNAMLKSEKSDGFQPFIQHISQLQPDVHGVGTTWPAANSLKWADHDESYQRWKSRHYRRLLHISGPPGSGTTVLATDLRRLALEARGYHQTTVLSFSFSRYDIRARSKRNALLSLSRQLLLARQDLFRFVEPICSFMLEQDLFNESIVWSLLQLLLAHSTESTIYCALYGIHECEEREEIMDLIHRLGSIVEASEGSVNVITTSDDVFASENLKLFPRARKVCINIASVGQHHTTFGIESLVRENVARLARQKPLWAEFENDIVNVLCDEQPSSYLSAIHRLAILESSDIRSTKDDLRRKLQELRSPGKELIIPSADYLGDYAWVLSALCWISCSVRPLTVSELSMAIAFDQFRGQRSLYREISSTDDVELPQDYSALLNIVPRDIIGDLGRRIGPLLRVDRNQVHLIHGNFRGALTDACARFQEPHGDPYYLLFRACLEYLKHLSAKATQNPLQLEQEDALLDYAVTYWPEHYKLASRNSDPRVDEYLDIFLDDKKCLKFWADRYRKMYMKDLLATACDFDLIRIHVTCRFGLVKQMEISKLNSFDTGTLQAALNLASGSGHLELVSGLFNHGVRLPTALPLAAAGGHSLVVFILMRDSEATVWKDEDGRTVLHHAILGGNCATVEALVRWANVGLNVQSTDGFTPLCLAAKTGQTPLVRILVVAGANMTLKDKRGMGPLQLAASAGFTEIVEILLNNGADLLDSSIDGDMALHLAVRLSHPITVRRLLQTNPPLDRVNDKGFTPLHIAAEQGHQEIVDMLLLAKPIEGSKRLEYIDTDNGGIAEKSLLHVTFTHTKPPLQLATMSGRTSIVKALLDRGKHRLEDCCRALYVAARTGLEDVTKTLLDHGVPIDFRDDWDSTVFHQAVVGGSIKVLELLLRRSSEITTVNTPDRDGKTALHEAAEKGSSAIVDLLLQNRADVDACTKFDHFTLLPVPATLELPEH